MLIATLHQDKSEVEKLIVEGDYDLATPLVVAAMMGNVELVKVCKRLF